MGGGRRRSLVSSVRWLPLCAFFISFFRFFLSFLISLIRAPFKRFLKTFVVSRRFAFVWREMSGEEERRGRASIPGDDDVRTKKKEKFESTSFWGIKTKNEWRKLRENFLWLWIGWKEVLTSRWMCKYVTCVDSFYSFTHVCDERCRYFRCGVTWYYLKRNFVEGK